jgi:hypothetical protein
VASSAELLVVLPLAAVALKRRRELADEEVAGLRHHRIHRDAYRAAWERITARIALAQPLPQSMTEEQARERPDAEAEWHAMLVGDTPERAQADEQTLMRFLEGDDQGAGRARLAYLHDRVVDWPVWGQRVRPIIGTMSDEHAWVAYIDIEGSLVFCQPHVHPITRWIEGLLAHDEAPQELPESIGAYLVRHYDELHARFGMPAEWRPFQTFPPDWPEGPIWPAWSCTGCGYPIPDLGRFPTCPLGGCGGKTRVRRDLEAFVARAR